MTTISASGTFSFSPTQQVHRLGFGAMRVTGEGIWGPPKDPAEAKRTLRRVLELGIDFIDTADAYGPNVSEELLAETLHPYPARLIIATKGGLTRSGPNRWAPNGRPEYLRSCIEGSLTRLKLERLPLWQLHRIDSKVPADEQFSAIASFQKEGLIEHVGLSEVSVSELRHAQKHFTVASVQNRYNVSDRQSEPVLKVCEQENIAFIPWSPLGAGALTAQRSFRTVATKHSVSEGVVALAWLLQKSPVMVPIPGTSKVKHLEENCSAATVKLSADDVAALEQ